MKTKYEVPAEDILRAAEAEAKALHVTRIDFGIFPFRCAAVSAASELSALVEYFRVHDENWHAAALKIDPKMHANTCWVTYLRHSDASCFFLFAPPFEDRPEWYIAAAHECLHLCQFALPLLGTFDRNMEIEGEAYLHTHLMRQVIDAMRD